MKTFIIFILFLLTLSFNSFSQSNLDTDESFQVSSVSNPGRDYIITSTGRQEIVASSDLVTTAGGNMEFRVNSLGLTNRALQIKSNSGPVFFKVLTDNESVGIGLGSANPETKLHVKGGDLYLEDIQSGVILKAQNGQCWKLTIDNNGNISSTNMTCP